MDRDREPRPADARAEQPLPWRRQERLQPSAQAGEAAAAPWRREVAPHQSAGDEAGQEQRQGRQRGDEGRAWRCWRTHPSPRRAQSQDRRRARTPIRVPAAATTGPRDGGAAPEAGDAMAEAAGAAASTSSNNRRPAAPGRSDLPGRRNAHRQVRMSLEELSKDDGVRIVEKLSDEAMLATFEETTRDKDLSQDKIRLIVTILAKVCQVEYQPIVLPLFQKACRKEFLDQLLLHIVQLGMDKSMARREAVGAFYRDFCTLCYGIIRKLPDVACEKLENLVRKAASELADLAPFEGSDSVKRDLDAVKDRIGLEKERMAKARAPAQRKAARADRADARGPPPDNFRDLPVFPTVDDITAPCRPYLRKNKVSGPYDNVQHYLDVQYRLLKEDFVGPLRDGVREYCEKLAEPSARNRHIKVNNIRVYREARFLGVRVEDDRIGLELCFDSAGKFAANINWEFSKRLNPGSLLVLTREASFSAVTLVTVSRRDLKDLQKGRVTVELCEGGVSLESLFKGHFLMVECTVYFGPYSHVLRALKGFDESSFPLKEYLVYASSVAQLPPYLAGSNTFVYVPLRSDDRATVAETWPVQVADDSTWPTAGELGLDESQFEAFKGAITNQVMLVQGPPGTGKTFLGLKVASCLLLNQSLWNTKERPRPMLVVCYTNHALDQFLCGILSATDKVVRVGGGCKEPRLEPYCINNLRRTHRSAADRNELNRRVRDQRNRLNSIRRVSDSLRGCYDQLTAGAGLVSPETLFRYQIISAKQWKYLQKVSVVRWLCGDAAEALDWTSHREVLLHTQTSDGWDLSHVEAKEYFTVLKDVEFSLSCSSLEKLAKESSDTDERAFKEEAEFIGDMIATIKQGLGAHAEKRSTHLSRSEDDLWTYDSTERWLLYSEWVEELMQIYIEPALDQIDVEYSAAGVVLQEWRMVEDQAIMADNLVIGMTTSYAASRQQILKALKPSIVIVEEAAEVFEAHLLVSLAGEVEHLVMIGDHKQLRPKPSVHELALDYHLDVSMFERLINNGVRCVTLTTQHRMRPEVASLICPAIYPSLINHPSVKLFPRVRGVAKNLFFVNHEHPEEEMKDAKSYQNVHEALFVASLARYLLQQGYDASRITILSTYKGQQFYLQRLRRESAPHLQDVRISVVDNYQGEECDIILLSLVRSNAEQSVGFVKTENRVCVALSRAKHGLFIVGNMTNMTSEDTVWRSVKAELVRQGSLGAALPLRCEFHGTASGVASAEDFLARCPQGGCDRLCDAVLACGHDCPQVCHTQDREHAAVMCMERCEREVCPQQHICPDRCYQPCQPCQVPKIEQLSCLHLAKMPCHRNPQDHKCTADVTVTLPACGHTRRAQCHQKLETLPCKEPCAVPLPSCDHECGQTCHVLKDPQHEKHKCRMICGRTKPGCSMQHICRKECHVPCGGCDVKVEKELPCGHKYKLECQADPADKQCTYRCKRVAACGHACGKLCHEPCTPCLTKVRKTLPGCGHEQEMACGQDAALTRCDAPCQRTLPCGHRCRLKCSEDCSEGACEEPSPLRAACGHDVMVPCSKRASCDPSSPDLLDLCGAPCDVPRACGHDCGQTCHLLDDLEHKKSNCRKSCNRMRAGCTGKHPCAKLCYETCDDCDIVVKKELACGHKYKMKCSVDPATKECTKKCERTRVCGHKCSKRCSEYCGTCPEMVMKEVPQCKHEQLMECGSDPSLFSSCDCACERFLICGHRCPLRCGEDCAEAACQEPVPFRAACGHDVPAPCCKRGTLGAHDPEILVLCKEPCNSRLLCQHQCQGVCSKCLQGRLHAPCKSACQRTLVCGHACKSTCSASCPPCAQCNTPATREAVKAVARRAREILQDVVAFPREFRHAAELFSQACQELKEVENILSAGDANTSALSEAETLNLEQYSRMIRSLSRIVEMAFSTTETGQPSLRDSGLKDLVQSVELLSSCSGLSKSSLGQMSDQEASDINMELERLRRLAQLCLVESGPNFEHLFAAEKDMYDCVSDSVRSLAPYRDNQHRFVRTMLQNLATMAKIVFKDPEIDTVIAAPGFRLEASK